ncbi:amidase [Mesorhizobium abyssinicae]|uniref:amidase n=1 Tax=Mesorhizobium abyssinicae TaxID=1209958 RepID=UPI002A23BF52|nr:amidase [Mesorhizobium abyssinicae]MDX8433369.1 amidase [Mesorhizobium abyssinicae]
MNLAQYMASDAVALAGHVRSGELSPVEIAEAAIEAIELLNPVINAVTLIDAERALAAAANCDAKAALAGVPFLVKDTGVHVREWPTTHASLYFRDAAPKPDSEIVRRWRTAGLTLLGKTNTPEFANDFVTEPVIHGPTLNPWDLSVTAGGSSGGAAAAVASGIVPLAHGSDIGGSIRVPAACCGVFGMKPSRGLNPVGPYRDQVGAGLFVENVLSRTVRDTAAMLDITVGPEPGAPCFVSRSVPSYLDWLSSPAERMRIACVAHRPDGTPVAAEIGEKFRQAMALLEEMGHEVIQARFPPEADGGAEWSIFWMSEVALLVDERANDIGRMPLPGEIEALSLHALDRFRRSSAADYLKAQAGQHRASLAMARTFDGFDLIMTPATADLPPLIGAVRGDDAAFDYAAWVDRAYGFAPFTEIFNVTGQPAASLPLFLSKDGLPIGIQLAGRPNEDHRLLGISYALEQATGWSKRRPPVQARLAALAIELRGTCPRNGAITARLAE